VRILENRLDAQQAGPVELARPGENRGRANREHNRAAILPQILPVRGTMWRPRGAGFPHFAPAGAELCKF
jgi:hypothetical protein